MTESFYYPSTLNRDLLIHILDADPATCEALSVLFRLEGFQTAFSVDSASFFAAIAQRPPDLVVLNLRIGSESGLAILKHIRMLRPATPVFVIEDRPEVDSAVEAMKAGAADVITKPIDSDRLVRGIADALRREALPERGGRRALQLRDFARLTPREREVLLLITSGQSNKQAGRELGISPRTIEVHRARVMEKLGARNTADLMSIVLTS